MTQLLLKKSQTKVVKVTKSEFAESCLWLRGSPYSLADYPHMRTIFNIEADDLVLQFSRQTSKCIVNNSLQRLADGTLKLAENLKIGDELLSFDEESQKIVINKIKSVEPNGKQVVYKIKTRTGKVVGVTGEHPLWTLNPKWTEARDLQVGDLIGLSRNNSVAVPEEKTVPDYQYVILVHLLAEGCLSGGGIKYTNSEIENVEELREAIKEFDSSLELSPIGEKYPYEYSITNHTQKNSLITWLKELSLYGCKSDTKFYPDLIFKLTKKQIQNCLRIFWNTDGYVSTAHKTRKLPTIGIGLISENLIDGIQELLLRLGIHSTKKIQIPKVYNGTSKRVYVLTVEGADSVEKFYSLIHTRKLKSYQKTEQNSNRLVISKKALQPYFVKLKKKNFGKIKGERHKHGYVNYTLDYNITYSKLKDWVDSTNDGYLKTIYNADIIYDRIISIEILPPEETTNIEMEFPYNNFFIDNILTHNSTTLAAMTATNSILMPGYQSLYVAPTVDQSKIFSHDRLAPFLEGSPWVKKHYLSSSLIQNVFTKQLLNQSKIYVRYALLTADRLRGLSADQICYDETQDLVLDLIPVIDEVMSRSNYKKRIFAGTPKLTRGTLAFHWKRSTRNEWFVKCPGCSKYNYLDENNIGKNGLICRYCGHLMDPKNGCWVRTGEVDAPFEGFRVCALQFANAPWVNWKKDIIRKYENQPRGLFFNEVLALAYDPGVAPVTEEDVKACCTGGPLLHAATPSVASMAPIYMGIDYGPANSENSYTVICALQPLPNEVIRVLFLKKYMGKEADFHFIHQDVPELFNKWGAKLIGADYGLGEASNSEIGSKIGEDKILPFFHSTQKERIKYNPKMNIYTTSRLKVMTEFFTRIKHKKIIFPNWDEFEPFANDILSTSIEYSKDGTKIKYVNTDPDDSLHAMIYATLLCEMDAPSRIRYDWEFDDPNAGLY